eukprot:514793-Rhodomonas_salina.1
MPTQTVALLMFGTDFTAGTSHQHASAWRVDGSVSVHLESGGWDMREVLPGLAEGIAVVEHAREAKVPCTPTNAPAQHKCQAEDSHMLRASDDGDS